MITMDLVNISAIVFGACFIAFLLFVGWIVWRDDREDDREMEKELSKTD